MNRVFTYLFHDSRENTIRLSNGPDEWDEDLTGWEYIMDLVNGVDYYRKNTRNGYIFAVKL